MLALCLMLSVTYYAQNYAGIIGCSLELTMSKVSDPHGFATFSNLPALTWPCLKSSVKLTTWLGVL